VSYLSLTKKICLSAAGFSINQTESYTYKYTLLISLSLSLPRDRHRFIIEEETTHGNYGCVFLYYCYYYLSNKIWIDVKNKLMPFYLEDRLLNLATNLVSGVECTTMQPADTSTEPKSKYINERSFARLK